MTFSSVYLFKVFQTCFKNHNRLINTLTDNNLQEKSCKIMEKTVKRVKTFK